MVAAVAAIVAVAVWAIVSYAVDTTSRVPQQQTLLHQAMLEGFSGLARGIVPERQTLLDKAMLAGFPGLVRGVDRP
jgi:hypothetical protein